MAASSSTSKRRRSYDVFLSFRGTDVRKNFLSHLYTALDLRGINTYMDDEELSKGEEISSALMEAIEESQIAIVVFSKDYASSPWCLDELAKIMDCKEQRDLMIFPVFYKVEPCEVRTPRKSYLEAMAEHEDKFGKDSEKVKRWKKALSGAGSLSGLHFTDGYEAELIQHIVREISTRVNRTPLHVAKYPVGLDSRVQEVKTILNLQSKDDVLMVGLWGQGGVGKTTLAKAIYNAVFREFQGSCFLERVRENSKSSNDLVALQEKLLSQVLPGTEFKVYSAPQGSCLIQDRLCNKKVLIILDDVDGEVQLNALAGNCQWFDNGSRIIITTRNKQHLISHGVSRDRIYEVEALEKDQALELFRKHAFPRNKKIEISSDLVERVLYYANGLPLALEVLGSFLCGRGECDWKSTLKTLAKSPREEINNVLKVSYDGLEHNEREIFLDIACFFKGCETEYIKKVLDSCDFGTTIGVDVLIERSLIREEGRSLQMHHLLQSMGMDIVKQECYHDPGERSRLWLREDVADVLSGDAGTAKIKAIVLRSREREEMYIDPNAFTKMRNLRLLILEGVDNSFQGPTHLSNKLRWLEWRNCGWFPEFGPGPKKLVGLVMPKSKIKVVPEQFKDFKELKFINFSKCQSLVCMPNLSYMPELKELNLSGCNNLERAHESVAYHGKLQLLNLSECSKLHPLNVLQLRKLQCLILANCSKLQRFPNGLDKAKDLRELNLNGTSIKELPIYIGSLVFLEKLNLSRCKELEILPSSIYRLQNLDELELGECSKLIEFPKSDPHIKTGFSKLRDLGLSKCNLSELQEILEIPSQLNELKAEGCKALSKIPSDIGHVDVINLTSCHELVRNGFTINDLFKSKHWRTHRKLQVYLPGGELPEWFVPNDEGHISFAVSKDLFEKKFIGLAFCVVFRESEGQAATFAVQQLVNGEYSQGSFLYYKVDSDHVMLQCSKYWSGKDFHRNDWSHFQLIIRALDGSATVKKCGFRLIFKPLENDLQVLLQHNPLLDPALLHMVQDDDSPMSTMEESSNKREDLLDSKTSAEENTSSNSVLKMLEMAYFSLQVHRYSRIHHYLQNIRPGGEMPEEFVPVEDGTIRFMASQDLYDKILGLALCVVFSVKDGQKKVFFDILPHVNGQRRNVQSGMLGSFDSDHVWFQYLKSNMLWGMLEGRVDFSEFGESYVQFSLSLKVSHGTVKKLGYVIKCKKLEDDLKVVLEKNQLVNLASLCEDSPHVGDSEIGLNLGREVERRVYYRRCHLHMEEREAGDSETDHMEEREASDSETDETGGCERKPSVVVRSNNLRGKNEQNHP